MQYYPHLQGRNRGSGNEFLAPGYLTSNCWRQESHPGWSHLTFVHVPVGPTPQKPFRVMLPKYLGVVRCDHRRTQIKESIKKKVFSLQKVEVKSRESLASIQLYFDAY